MNTLLQIPADVFGFAVVGIIIGALVVGALGFAAVAQLILFFKYHKYKKTQIEAGYTAQDAARALLDANGLQNVSVKKLGFFRMLFYGNHYNVLSKTIYLRKSIINSKSITAVGVALQKVGLAVQDSQNVKGFRFKSIMQLLGVFGPVLFIPIVIVGVILDAALFGFSGVASVVSVVIGFAFYLLAFIFTLMNIKIEKRANVIALEMLEGSNILNSNEMEDVKEVFSAYILSYVADSIVAFLKLLEYIYKILRVAIKRK